jgi:ligand-binding sensor domain-containing protein/two-component sensor histidine kinase
MTLLSCIRPFLCVSLALVAGLLSNAKAQSPVHESSTRFTHLSAEQGLSQNTILCSWQDKDGFLWFGTRDGLNKYDGYSFVVYKPDPADPAHTFGHNIITDICEDRAGRMWVTTLGGGLHQFDRRTGKATAYRIDPAHISLRNAMFSITEDHEGMLWIASREGLNRFDPRTKRFSFFPGPSTPDVYVVQEDNQGTLWVGGQHGLYKFDRRTATYTRFKLPSDASVPILVMLVDRRGTLWVESDNGQLYELSPDGKVSHYTFPCSLLKENKPQLRNVALLYDAVGHLWIALPGQSGLVRLDPNTGQWVSFKANPMQAGSLSSNQIFSLSQDWEGTLWIGTDNGLDKLAPLPDKFRTIQIRPNNGNTRLPENSIKALCQDRAGTVWLANESDGLYSFTLASGRYNHYQADSIWPDRLYSNEVNAIWESRAGQLWVGAGNYLHKLDRKTGQFTRYRCVIGTRSIREDSAGNLWIGDKGLACFHPQTNQFTYYRYDPDNPTSLGDERLTVALPTRHGTIWAASLRRGLNRLDVATGRFTHYRPDFQHPVGQLNDKDLRCLYEDSKGRLWIGTNQGGLNLFNDSTQNFRAFTTHQGLPSNHIVGILEGSDGNLWLSTNQGICCFNPTTHVCRNYDKDDGLQANEFIEAYAQGTKGELLFGGPDGFTIFSPRAIRTNERIPPVHITKVRIDKQSVPISSQPLTLSYEENDIDFDFVALNYIRPDKNQYAYQLIGVDKDWIYCGTRRFVSYANLAPGEYHFRVKAANNDGVWNEKGTSLTIHIRPPFWRTVWFICLVTCVLLGLIYFGFRYRIRQIREQEQQKTTVSKRLAELEMQALRAQMNPHFIFNSLNSINRFIMKNESEAASDYLSKFSKLIRLILQNTTAQTVTLESELEALTLYLKLESLRFDGQFTFSIRVDDEIEPEYTEIPPMIIQPYVENAIWHGLMQKESDRHLTVDIKKRNNQLICTVEDNGVGRQKAAELKSKSATHTKSMGTQITADRLKLSQALYGQQPTVHIYDLTAANGEPAGTRVILTIPLL